MFELAPRLQQFLQGLKILEEILLTFQTFSQFTILLPPKQSVTIKTPFTFIFHVLALLIKVAYPLAVN